MIKNFIKDNFIRPDDTAADTAAKPRIKYIDLAKGIVIMMVVMFHNNLFTDVPSLTAARMPLYFVLSGLFFKSYGGFFEFLFKKVNNILIPFLFFALIGFVWATGVDNLKVSYVASTVWHRPYIHNVAIWFLICLFQVNLIFYLIHRYCPALYLRIAAVTACGVAGYMLHRSGIYIPLFVASALSAVPFFYFGMLARRLLLNLTASTRVTLGIALLLLAEGFIFSWLRDTPSIEFRINNYHGANPIEIYLNSLVMVTGLLLLCRAIVWLPIVSYFGRYSIIVLGFHMPVMAALRSVMPSLIDHTLSNVETALLTLLICWLLIPLCRRFIPVLTAQSPLVGPRRRRQQAVGQC